MRGRGNAGDKPGGAEAPAQFMEVLRAKEGSWLEATSMCDWRCHPARALARLTHLLHQHES